MLVLVLTSVPLLNSGEWLFTPKRRGTKRYKGPIEKLLLSFVCMLVLSGYLVDILQL